MNKLIQYKWWILGALMTGGLVFGQVAVDKVPDNLKLKCDKSNIIGVNEKGSDVMYKYYTHEIPQTEITLGKKQIKEEIDKRVNNALFYKLEETLTEKKWQGVFYSGEPFYKKQDKWFQTETATTTKDAFEKQTVSFLDNLFGRNALATNYYAGAGDGNVYGYWGGTTYPWADFREEDAEQVQNLANTYMAGVRHGTTATNWRHWWRASFPFDTSGLPDSINISAASVFIYGSGGTFTLTCDATERIFHLVSHNRVSNTTLAIGDGEFADYGTTSFGSFDVGSDGSLWSEAYNEFELNQDGIDTISVDDYTVFAVDPGSLFSNSEPSATGDYQWWTPNCYYSEETGTDKDPYLAVTYSEGSVSAPKPVIRQRPNLIQ